MGLLRGVIDRLASDGRLAVDPADAVRIVMAANSGVALALILRHGTYPNLSISTTTREVTLRGILADGETSLVDPCGVAATTLRTNLPTLAADGTFTGAEAGLLEEWLARFRIN
jgi:hypothetical protein